MRYAVLLIGIGMLSVPPTIAQSTTGLTSYTDLGTVTNGTVTVTLDDRAAYYYGKIAETPVDTDVDTVWRDIRLESTHTAPLWDNILPTPEILVQNHSTIDTSDLFPGQYALFLWGCETGHTVPQNCDWLEPRVFDIPASDRPDVSFSVTKHKIDDLHDGDGISIADINDDGDMDVAVASGRGGDVYWYEQETPYSWTRHTIQKSDRGFFDRLRQQPTSPFGEVEGIQLADVNQDGVYEILVLDQGEGHAWLMTPDPEDGRDPAGDWDRVRVDGDASDAQDVISRDVDDDGQPEFIYTYEGNNADEGGVYWLDYTGGDILDANSYRKHEMTQIAGAWGLPETWADFSGNGEPDLLVTVADRVGPESGLYYLEQPDDPTDTWPRTTIASGDGYKHASIGSISGPNTTDILASVFPHSGGGLYWFEQDGPDQFQRHRFSISLSDGDSYVDSSTLEFYHSQTIDIDKTGRSEIILVDKNGPEDLHFLSYETSRYHTYDPSPGSYIEHGAVHAGKTDERFVSHDIDRDGIQEAFSVAAHTHEFTWWNFDNRDGNQSQETGSQTDTPDFSPGQTPGSP